jgi:hypothetical protein
MDWKGFERRYGLVLGTITAFAWMDWNDYEEVVRDNRCNNKDIKPVAAEYEGISAP